MLLIVIIGGGLVGVVGRAVAVLDSSESSNDALVGNLGSTSSTR
jgi:hypothetical protein